MELILIKWDLVIIVLAIYNSISIPLGLAFSPPSYEYTWVKVFNYFIDSFFLFDMILQFRTTYVNPITGAEIYDSKMIAKNYLKGRFWIDLISIIPFELAAKFVDAENKSFRVFSCMKLIRILRLGRLINYLNESNDFKL